jgi:hypothetical protein
MTLLASQTAALSAVLELGWRAVVSSAYYPIVADEYGTDFAAPAVGVGTDRDSERHVVDSTRAVSLVVRLELDHGSDTLAARRESSTVNSLA